MNRRTLFLGSSKETSKRTLFSALRTRLEKSFDVVAWNTPGTFRANRYFMEDLLRIAKVVDGAVLIFGRDDTKIVRKRRSLHTRDNVLLEYSFFAGQLGRARSYILSERGVVVPSDLAGIVIPQTSRAVDSLVKTIDCEVSKRPAIHSPFHVRDGGVGIANTLAHAAELLQSACAKYDKRNTVDKDLPLHLDTSILCKEAYAEALDRVEVSFLTTTFLTSGFWITPDTTISGSNKRMLERVSGVKGSAKRLFVMRSTVEHVADARRHDLLLMRRRGRSEDITRLRQELASLRSSVESMLANRCEVRFVPATWIDFKELRDPLNFDSMDSELAIYDDFRVDVFSGGGAGKITGVRIFDKRMPGFRDGILESAKATFARLWAKGLDARHCLAVIAQAEEEACRAVDYTRNHLFKFDNLGEGEERTVMERELAVVRDVVKQWSDSRRKRPVRVLDVGTCTARYPIALQDMLSPGGEILGIDLDPDCVFHSAQRVKEKAIDPGRIRIDEIDFLSDAVLLHGQFDIITIMLGTVSHFPSSRDGTLDDALQIAADHCARMLAEGGLLIVGTWTSVALRSGHLLSMYEHDTPSLLMSWTPTEEALVAHCRRAGLQRSPLSRLAHPRLSVLVFCHQSPRRVLAAAKLSGQANRARATKSSQAVPRSSPGTFPSNKL
jgi:SAM-dependent methyltransferase